MDEERKREITPAECAVFVSKSGSMRDRQSLAEGFG